MKTLYFLKFCKMIGSVRYDRYHLPCNTASNPIHTKTVISFHRKRLVGFSFYGTLCKLMQQRMMHISFSRERLLFKLPHNLAN